MRASGTLVLAIVDDGGNLMYLERIQPTFVDGHQWVEGPVWVPDTSGGYLLFSDVAANTIYRWKENEGESVFLRPSGYTGGALVAPSSGADRRRATLGQL